MRHALTALAVCLALAGTAFGATYYVSTSGNDGWVGSQAQPWRTLQHAVDSISPGDTILVANGTYVGCWINNSGTSGAVKTLKNQTAGQGVIVNSRGSNPHDAVMDIDGADYWVIDGLVINGMDSYMYGFFTVLSDHITIRNCVAHGAYYTNFLSGFADYLLEENNEAFTTTVQHGFYNGDSDDYTVERHNISHDNTLCGFHHNGGAPDGGDGTINYLLSEKNIAYNNGGAVMNCDGVVDSKIINNLGYNNRHLGVALYWIDGAVASSRNLVYNNTFHFTTQGYDCVYVADDCVDNKIRNNILIQERTGYGSICLANTSMGSGFASDYNVVVDRFSVNDGGSYISLASWRGYGWDTHSLISTASALFVTPGSNYHLKAGSPAINAGTTVAEVTDDLDGASRPQGGAYDCGCYESAGGVSDLVITTTSLPAGRVATAYSQTLVATGGQTPYTWSMNGGSLPSGLSLSSGGVISGTPTGAGTSNFTVRVTDSQGTPDTDDQALSILIYADLNITTTSLPGGVVGTAYSQTLAATGGLTPYTWSMNGGSLPSGLSLSSGGVISGTPTGAGTSNFTVRVTDSQGAPDTDNQALSITISPSIQDLVITTTSLPGGTVGVAYSQTVQATGGVTPYSWSISSGTLPAGLSINSSSGVISGTPTTAQTSNFTVRVQDSQGTPDVDTQALSIVISGGGSSATYQFVAQDTESSTTSTTYQTKATLTFTPNAADDWIILGFAEYKSSSGSYSALLRLTVDGNVDAEITKEPKDTTDYIAFQTAKFRNLTAAAHTVNLDYRSENSGATVYIRRARIVAIRKSGIGMYQAATDGTTALTTTLTNITTLNFAPAATNDYLLIYTAEVNANTSYSTQMQAKYSSTTYDDSWIEVKDNTDYVSWLNFSMFSAGPGGQTATITAAKETGSTATHNIRKARVMAIQLTGGRFQEYNGTASDAVSTTTSTTFVEKRSCTWSNGANGNWLLLASGRINNTNATYSTEVRLQLNDTTTLVQQLAEPKDTTDWMHYGMIDVRNLTTPRDVDTDYRTENAAGTAGIKYTRFYCLPL